MNKPSTHQELSAWDKRSSQSIETIHEGVHRMWMHGAQIVCYSVTTVTRPAIDAWKEATLELASVWPTERPYLAIEDFSESSLTPYIREQATKINMAWPPKLKGRSAIVAPRNVLTERFGFFVTRDLNPQNPNIQRAVFSRLEDAVDWLEKGIMLNQNQVEKSEK